MNNSLAGRGGGGWIVIVPEVRQSSESVTSRGIYMEIPYAFGETCFSPRLVSFSFRETQPHGCVYKVRPFEPITRDLVGFASREITPLYLYAAFFFTLVFLSLLLPSHPFRSQYLFCLDRSTRSVIPHFESRYIITGDRSDISRRERGKERRGKFRNLAVERTICA